MKKILIKPEQLTAQGGLRIALIYAAVGALWIIFSDLAVDWIFGRSGTTFIAQTLKGWFFVCASALLVYLLTSREIASIKESEKDLLDSQRILATLFENLPGMVYRCGCDVECLLDFVSPRAAT